jgi:hypothetical protein
MGRLDKLRLPRSGTVAPRHGTPVQRHGAVQGWSIGGRESTAVQLIGSEM